MALFLKAGLFPPLDRTLVVRAVSCVRVLGKQKAELALTAVAVTFLALRVELLWTLQFLRDCSSSGDSTSVLLAESELID